MHFDQNLIFVRHGFFHFLELENLRWSISFIDNSFHLSSHSSKFKSTFLPLFNIHTFGKQPDDL